MVTTDNNMKVAMIPFGTREEVKELQARLVNMLPSLMPNSVKLTNDESLALAQVALAHGLSPFNNEIYYLKNGDRNLGVFPGIRGYRKAAHRQIKRDGGTYWLSEPKLVHATEYGGEDGDICTVYELRDSVTMGSYLKLRGMIFEINHLPQDILKMAKEEGQAITNIKTAIEQTAIELLGTPPITLGVGIVKKYEIENRMKKAGLSPIHISQIRAERAALRKRFDLDLVFGGSDEVWREAETVDAMVESIENEEASHHDIDKEKLKKELGF